MPILEQRDPGFRTVKQLVNRMATSVSSDVCVSVEDENVPAWQRQLVWTHEEMGLLALSLIRNFPIGIIILWKKPDGVRVPIDGRQRLTAIRAFFDGEVAIPDLPTVPEEFKRTKYRIKPGDEDRGLKQLPLKYREIFDDFELRIVQYDRIDEKTAMEIFVMLQGGKSLTKTEVRAALGGQLCDFVSELTSHRSRSRHPFFRSLSRNLKDRRKSHRNVADILLHEYLRPGQDKHWTSLEQMYRDKSDSLSRREKTGFEQELSQFHRAVTIRVDGEAIVLPQLRSAFLVLDVYRAWRELAGEYDLPAGAQFSAAIRDFETQRAAYRDELPWIVYTNELSNAGYAQNRIQSRHRILMSYLLQYFPGATVRRRDRRAFTDAQKVAIWERANHRCEWRDARRRCKETFVDFRSADADHIVKWSRNGPTTVDNGRLLCPAHNRARR